MSRLQINPPVVTVYPNDRQLFTAQAAPPPALWAGSVGAHILADSSLIIDALASSMSAGSGHRLFSGIGIIEFQINDLFRPISTGQFVFTGFINDLVGFQYVFGVEINTSTVRVLAEGATVIYFETYTTASGDVYRLELNAGFRLYRNGVLKHSRTGLPSQVVYPMSYALSLLEPVATDPATIPSPRLIGDWRLAPVVAFTTPSHGSLTTTGAALTTEYFGGSVPGRYTLAVQVDPSADGVFTQKATATIDIPALQILGSSEVVLQPGQKVRFKTNYDVAQNPLITWSVVSGGGSFLNGEFTAPTAPGVTVVRATSGGQIANITITIPAVITPERSGFAAGEVVDWVTNLASPVWSASAGSINSGTGLWTAPQLPIATARITATSGGVIATRDVDIVEKFPRSNFILPWAIDFAKRELISEAEDGTRTSRIKSSARRSFPVNLLVDTVDDLQVIRDFWNSHHPGVRFIIEDPEEEIRVLVYSDSALRWEHIGAGINVAFRVKEAE